MGEWSRSYYIRLKDWKGVRRVWPAGDTLKTARAKCAEYEHRAALKEDFNKDKVRSMTFAEWGELYLERYVSKKPSQQEDVRHVAALCTFKQARKERLPYKKRPVSDAYCNRELATLRHMLRLAFEEGLVETIPLVRLHKEEGGRERTFSPEEYQGTPSGLARASPADHHVCLRDGHARRRNQKSNMGEERPENGLSAAGDDRYEVERETRHSDFSRLAGNP